MKMKNHSKLLFCPYEIQHQKKNFFQMVKIGTTFSTLSLTKLQLISFYLHHRRIFYEAQILRYVDFFWVSCRETPCMSYCVFPGQSVYHVYPSPPMRYA